MFDCTFEFCFPININFTKLQPVVIARHYDKRKGHCTAATACIDNKL